MRDATTSNENGIGLRGVAGVLASTRRSLPELDSDRLLDSSVETLAGFGFDRSHVCAPDEAPESMALEAARRALADARVDPDEIDVLIWASARPECHVRRVTGEVAMMDGFRYSAGWLQDTLRLDNAAVMAVAQQGCATMFSAIRTARALLAAESGMRNVLCVGTDALPPGSKREVLYNVISDAACAVVVSRDASGDRWLGYRQLSRGHCWDPTGRRAEILAAYYPTAQRVVTALLEDHGLGPGDVDRVIPTGVHRESWDILLRLTGIPADRLFARRRFGHTITADNFIHLSDFRARHPPGSGEKLLLFTYGFGSSWCAMLLEH